MTADRRRVRLLVASAFITACGGRFEGSLSQSSKDAQPPDVGELLDAAAVATGAADADASLSDAISPPPRRDSGSDTFEEAGSHDDAGLDASEDAGSPYMLQDAGVDPFTACLGQDVFIIAGSDVAYSGPPLFLPISPSDVIDTLNVGPIPSQEFGLFTNLDGGPGWTLKFGTPGAATPLALGSYPNADSDQMATSHPLLSVAAAGRGCAASTGSFQIIEWNWPAETVVFEQHCPGGESKNIGCMSVH